MNNAWSSIALRAHASAPQKAPLLQLFNGYAKSHSTRSFVQWSTFKSSHKRSHIPFPKRSESISNHGFSTSTTSNARAKKQPLAKPKSRTTSKHPIVQTKAEKLRSTTKNDSKLQPAQTVASHTEGLPTANWAEQLTWRDYDPVGGMPLPNGELSQPEINAIFNGEDVDVDTGNYILSVMHWRRISGALVDVGLDFPKESGVTQEQALEGLKHIRSLLPDVDEEQNGQVWAEEEQNRLQKEIQARSVKLGLYKAQPNEETEQEPDPSPEPEPSQQGTPEGRERTGESVLIRTRKDKEASFEKWQAEKVAKEEQIKRNLAAAGRGPLELVGGVVPVVTNVQLSTRVKGPLGLSFKVPGTVSIGPPQAKAYLSPVERKPWVKYYEKHATIIKNNNIPQMSTVARLGPSFLVLLAVFAGCYYLSENYTPPPKSARLWPETPPAVSTMYAITGVLFATFIMGRIPPLWRTYSKYMTVVPAYPFALSLIGATFRHDTFRHILGNVVSLWLFGLILHEDVGRGTFLAIYLASGVAGAYTSLVYNVFRKQWMSYIFGSSGSVLGVTAAACTLHPNGKLNVFGVDIPIAAWVFLALVTGAEAVAAVRGLKTTIDHAGHVGGIVGGMLTAGALRMRTQQQKTHERGMVDTMSKVTDKTGDDEQMAVTRT